MQTSASLIGSDVLGLQDPDVLSIEQLDEDWAIPCDYTDVRRKNSKAGFTLHDSVGGGDQPAEWILLMRCPECGKAFQRLTCTPCKDFIMSTEDAAECGTTGDIIVPFRRLVVWTGPLNSTT